MYEFWATFDLGEESMLVDPVIVDGFADILGQVMLDIPSWADGGVRGFHHRTLQILRHRCCQCHVGIGIGRCWCSRPLLAIFLVIINIHIHRLPLLRRWRRRDRLRHFPSFFSKCFSQLCKFLLHLCRIRGISAFALGFHSRRRIWAKAQLTNQPIFTGFKELVHR